MSPTTNIKLESLEVCQTELCYVTAVNNKETFFAQFCKFPNEDLVKFNVAVGNYCKQTLASGRPRTMNEICQPGDILAAKYALDENWYRAKVLAVDRQRKLCSVEFVDYGNREKVPMSDLIFVDPAALPEFRRAPFGVQCKLNLESDIPRVLNCLMSRYMLLKFPQSPTDGHWRITIPRHGYNIPFWLAYDPQSVVPEAMKRPETRLANAS